MNGWRYKLSSTSAKYTIVKLHSVFSTHGLPEQLASDNGSGFKSTKFQNYDSTCSNGIKHTFTSP